MLVCSGILNIYWASHPEFMRKDIQVVLFKGQVTN